MWFIIYICVLSIYVSCHTLYMCLTIYICILSIYVSYLYMCLIYICVYICVLSSIFVSYLYMCLLIVYICVLP